MAKNGKLAGDSIIQPPACSRKMVVGLRRDFCNLKVFVNFSALKHEICKYIS